MSVFVAPHRRVSQQTGTGIQYILGHVEDFVDHVVDRYLPEKGEILELGGGGFRFAIPVALKGRNITVLDLDESSLELTHILEQIARVTDTQLPSHLLQQRIKSQQGDLFGFLGNSSESFSLIASFRVIHFFNPEQMNQFFELVKARLVPGGCLAVSSITPYDTSKSGSVYNEIYLNSDPASASQILYRRFKNTPEAAALMEHINLPAEMHMIDENFMSSIASQYGFEVVEKSSQSTRMVDGYVLRKLG